MYNKNLSNIKTSEQPEDFFLHNMIDSNEIKSYTDSLKNKFNNMPPIAIKYMKKNLNNTDYESLETCLDQEALYQMICSETEDHKNAVLAFVNKEKVAFKGK